MLQPFQINFVILHSGNRFRDREPASQPLAFPFGRYIAVLKDIFSFV